VRHTVRPPPERVEQAAARTPVLGRRGDGTGRFHARDHARPAHGTGARRRRPGPPSAPRGAARRRLRVTGDATIRATDGPTARSPCVPADRSGTGRSGSGYSGTVK
jgi:hypothetical protein